MMQVSCKWSNKITRVVSLVARPYKKLLIHVLGRLPYHVNMWRHRSLTPACSLGIFSDYLLLNSKVVFGKCININRENLHHNLSTYSASFCSLQKYFRNLPILRFSTKWSSFLNLGCFFKRQTSGVSRLIHIITNINCSLHFLSYNARF